MPISPPHQMTNGNASIAAKILARSHSTSRSGSPQTSGSGVPIDPNALVMAQLNNQINNLNNLNIQMSQQMNNPMNDLPPPPPIPEVNFTQKIHMTIIACTVYSASLYLLMNLFPKKNICFHFRCRQNLVQYLHRHLLLHQWTATMVQQFSSQQMVI